MSSRDKGRTMKILSREEGDSDTRRRDRDRDSRRREDRERRREKDKEASDKPVHGPIVLLKRPDAKPSGSSIAGNGGSFNSRTSSSTADGLMEASSSTKSHSSNTGGGPTLILQRSSKKDQESGEQSIGGEKTKSVGPPSVTELLKRPYQFPGGQALALIDSKMKLCPWKAFDYDANNYPGNMDFIVITAIGRASAGKSSVLSYLAGGNDDKFGARKVFPPRSREEEMQTSIYITKDQIVLIELSSVYNQAATNDLIPLVSQQGVLEVSNVTWNLRLVRWALSVSHVILVISENVFEPNVFQLMNSAEIIHSMDSALGEGSYPEPVYVCNKANLELLDHTEMVSEFQKHFTSVTGRTPRIETNYHVLPHTKYEMEYYRFEHFKQSILEFSRYNRAPFAQEKDGLSKLAQKNNLQDWYLNASRLWDEMSTPSFFSSYVKLLP